MNPEKGYNMDDGGSGGRPNQEVRDYLSKVGTEKWQNDPEYRERQVNARKETGQKPEFQEKMTKVNQEIARNPETLEKISKSISAKWKEKEYQENVSKGATNKWQESRHRERQFTARAEGRREISDKGEFLKDILEIKKKDLNAKYEMDGKSINKRIEEMLGHHGVKYFSQAKKYLEDKNLDDVLRDVNDRLSEQSQNSNRKKEISNKREFLEDLQNLKSKEIAQKYDMNRSTVNKRIQEMLGEHGVKNQTDAKEYLKDKDLDEVAKDINERLNDQKEKYEGKTVISNKREFLEDIQNIQKNEINQKYGMDAKTINNKIKEVFRGRDVKNYIEAKDYLRDKDINDVLKDIEKREAENQGEKSENKTDEKIPEGGNQQSEEIDKASLDEKDATEERDKSSVEGNQEEEADKTGEKPEEEAKDEKEKVSPEAQITEPKDSPEDAPTEEPDDQQQTQIEKPSDNQSNKSQEKSTRGKSFETILIPEPDGKKTKGKKIYDDMNGSIRESGPPAFIDDSFGDLASGDYAGNA